MDERVKIGFQKMYAEFFQITLLVCAASLIIKTLFLDMSISRCIPELPIIVAAPIYLAIRSRTLGITQVSTGSAHFRKQTLVSLIAGLLGFLLVSVTLSFRRGEPQSLPAILGYCVIFAVCFLLVYKIYHRIEKKRQDKLDSRYDDSDVD